MEQAKIDDSIITSISVPQLTQPPGSTTTCWTPSSTVKKTACSCPSMESSMVGTRGTMHTRRSISPASRRVACLHASSGSRWGPPSLPSATSPRACPMAREPLHQSQGGPRSQHRARGPHRQGRDDAEPGLLCARQDTVAHPSGICDDHQQSTGAYTPEGGSVPPGRCLFSRTVVRGVVSVWR